MQNQTPQPNAATASMPEPQNESPIWGANTLLMGPVGTGKTHSIGTWIATYNPLQRKWDLLPNNDLELFIIFTEPHMQVLAGLPPSRLHWKYIPPAVDSWKSMAENAKRLTDMSWDFLSKQTSDPNKRRYTSFVDILSACADFKCDRTGESFGCVDDWRPNRVLVLDGLSGLNHAALQMITGRAPSRTIPQWGCAMDNELAFINQACYATHAHFVLIAHPDRQKDEVQGGYKRMPLALGNKNAPEIPKNFRNTIEAKRNGSQFLWDTANTEADTVARDVPISDKLEPNFQQIYLAWKAAADAEQTHTKPQETAAM